MNNGPETMAIAPEASPFGPDLAGLLAIASDSSALQHVHRIELGLLASQPALTRVDEYPVRAAANVLRTATDGDDAVKGWGNFLVRLQVAATQGRGLPPGQFELFQLTPQLILENHARVLDAKAQADKDLELLATRQQGGTNQTLSYPEYDSRVDRRSLAGLMNNGMRISIRRDALESLTADNETPFLMQAMHLRIANINGFNGSYVNHAIHDGLDHWFAAYLLQQAGLADQFQSLFGRLGTPQDKNIYSLEGELTSQLFFSWRNTHNEQRPPTRGVSIDGMKHLLQPGIAGGMASSNQQEAYDELLSADPFSEEVAELEAIYSGSLMALISLQRKYGPIHEVDGMTGRPYGDFPLDDPEYLAFVIAVNNFIGSNQETLTNGLLNINVVLEDFLRSGSSETLDIHLDQIARPVSQTLRSINIPADTAKWFGAHPFKTGLIEDRAPTLARVNSNPRTYGGLVLNEM